jgi:hypothetical protein
VGKSKSDDGLLRSFLTWVLLYGLVFWNLGNQLISFIVSMTFYAFCRSDCSSILDRYMRFAYERLIFGLVWAPIVFAVAWFIWYWMKRRNS